jgi:hypothetical protein
MSASERDSGRELVLEQVESPKASDEREGNRGEHDQHLGEVSELNVQKNHHREQRERHEHFHALLHLAQKLVLPRPTHSPAFRHHQ